MVMGPEPMTIILCIVGFSGISIHIPFTVLGAGRVLPAGPLFR